MDANYKRIKDLLILQQYLDNRIHQEIEMVIGGYREPSKEELKESIDYIIEERLSYYK